jgi:hypothetical protein
MRNVLNKSCMENENTHFMLSNSFQKRAVCEMSKNMVEPEGVASDSMAAHCMLD